MTREPLRSRWRGWSWRQRHGQRGQGLVEFTFVLVVMMFMVVGVTDIATLLDVHESIVYAARQGARTGAVIGQATNADCAIVGAVHSALLNQPNLTVNLIYIYDVSTADGSRASGDKVDVYSGNTDCVNSAPSPPALAVGWPADTRNNTPFTNDDSLGVELDYSYQFQFNLLGTGSLSGTDYAVYQINPAGLPTPIPTPTGG